MPTPNSKERMSEVSDILEDAIATLGHQHPLTCEDGWGHCSCEFGKALQTVEKACKKYLKGLSILEAKASPAPEEGK